MPIAHNTALRGRRNVIALGWTSFFNDTATELAYWILPAFLTGPLGAGAAALGWIEGVAEGSASFARLLSGWWTDRVGRRKPFVVAGYLAANMVKPLLALTTSALQVLAIRTGDRISKGIRSAPRDAMLAESAEPGRRGSAFGFRQAMDSAGAVVGPLAAFLLLRQHFDFRTIFLFAAIPGAVCVFLVLAVVRETGSGRPTPDTPHSALRTPHSGSGRQVSPNPPLAVRNPQSAIRNPQFVRLMIAVSIFAIGNSSDLFLVLRAQDFGLTKLAPLLGLVFNVSYTLLAWPFGHLSDRLPRKALLASGYVVFAAVYAAFAHVRAAWHVWALFVLYGVYYALSEGVMKAMVADVVPAERRGHAYGILAAVYGALVLAASLITGQLWQRFGPALPFTLSAILALLAAFLVLTLESPQRTEPRRTQEPLPPASRKPGGSLRSRL